MGENLNPLKRISYKEQVSRSITWGHYFIFINILLACLLGFSYVYAAPPTTSLLSFFYLLVSWLGHMSFLTVVIYLVLFFPLAFIGNFRYYRVLCVVIAVIAHTILLFDIKIYLMVKVHLSMTAINLIVRELDFDTGLNYNFLFIAVPVVIALECVFAKITTHSLYRAHHPVFVRTVLVIVGSSFIASHVLHIWADANNYERITLLRSTFPVHYPMTARSFLSSHGWISEKQLQLESGGGSEFVKYPLSKLEFEQASGAAKDGAAGASGATTPNVLMISFNGLSYVNLTAEGAPQLYAFSEQVSSYNEHYLLYPQELNNVFASSYGLPLQYRNALLSEQTPPVVVDEMLRQDYVSRLIVSALPQTPKSVSLSLDDMGVTTRADYHNFDFTLASEATADAAAGTEGTQSTSALSAELSAEDHLHLNRYFNFLMQNAGLRSMQFSYAQDVNGVFSQALSLIESYHSFEHRPYALSLVVNDLRDFARNAKVSDELIANDPEAKELWLYDLTLKEVDAAFGRFISALQERGLLHNTLVIVTSNEGNRLLPYSAQHFNRERQHVPFLVLWPEERPANIRLPNTESSTAQAIATSRDLVDTALAVSHKQAQAATAAEAVGSASAPRARLGRSAARSCNNLTSPWDISATIARNVLHITSSSGNFTLGTDIKNCPLRDYLIADGKEELILIEDEDNIIYSHDGFSYIERNGERLQVRPNLENLIESMRDLNRFLR